jgi:type III secretory pathway component EscV
MSATTPPRLRWSDLVIAGLVLAVVTMMIVPLPRPLLDVLLSFNIALSVLVLMASVFVIQPLRFAAFPTVLVVTTLFRVGLNVSTTRLILAEGNAGEVVQAFGSAVVAGNFVVGLVVFLVITVVQIVVVARGAERVAEVGARFALDALPGRQMAIDADLRAGVIVAEEAQRRRDELTAESQLYGAMDGAMRFVKGDAIAAIVIVLINLVGGLILGIGYRGLSVAEAARTYSLLSVGEGLVAQIPSLLMAVASGILVTRAASAGDRGRDPAAALTQPRALLAAGGLLAVLAVVPGMPILPFGLTALLIAGAGLWLRAHPAAREDSLDADRHAVAQARLSRVAIRFGPVLLQTHDAAARATMLASVTDRVARDHGSLWTTLLDDSGAGQPLAPLEVEVRLDDAGAAWASAEFAHPDAITEALHRALAGIAPELITLDGTQARVDRAAQSHPVLVREVVPRVLGIAALAELLRALLREQVPIRDLAAVLEAVATAPAGLAGDRLYDHVRAALRRQISGRWAPAGQIEVFTVDALIEDAVRTAVDRRGERPVLALEPEIARDIVGAVRASVGERAAVVLASSDVRRHLRFLLEGELPEVAVLAPHELLPGTMVRAAGIIQVG